MSRDELRALTERLAPRQAAQTERLTHQRRGGLRHPGARGGIFPQKISNAERVLLTILHLRRLCTLDVLAAALGDVSRSAIGGVIRETRPLLERHDRTPAPAATRYRTAATSSPPDDEQATTRRQVDLLQLHKTGNVLSALAKSAHPGAKKALAEIWGAEDKDHARAARRSPTTSTSCWPSTTTPPSTGSTCARPTRSSRPSPPSATAPG